MFLLHGSIANKTIVQAQQLPKYEGIEGQCSSPERPGRFNLLPKRSVIGGDIFLLPDVAALFIQPSLCIIRPTLDVGSAFPDLKQCVAPIRHLQKLHIGVVSTCVERRI